MGKNLILITSIISLIMTIVYNFVSLSYTPKGILFYSLIVIWIVLTYFVFADVKKRNMPTIYVGTTLFLGGLGGLIYYFKIYKQSDQNLNSEQSSKISESSKKNLKFFSIFMAVIFGVAFIMTLPLTGGEINYIRSGVFGVLLALSIYVIRYASK
ncbi:hypothetical protein GOV04_05095 [Candidatus Woesearchaeota archaeon]|nr:hypothetical protein [Candidatus Woesearchaeota archaeon]